MLGATLAFTIMVACVKEARAEMDALEVIVWRTLVSVPLALALVWRIGLRVKAKKWLLARVTLGSIAMVCFFTAAKGLSVGDLSIVSRLQPIVVALVAPLVLGVAERAGGRVWVLLLTGLLGCALIVGPGLQVGNLFGLYALAATVASAGAHVCVRRLGRSDDPRVVVVWFQLAAFAFALFAQWLLHGSEGVWLPLPPRHLWWPIAGIGVCATLGQVLMTFAYRAERAPTVAAATYAAPAFGIAIDLIVFAVYPTPLALLGGVIVVGAGLVLVFRRVEGSSDARDV